MEDGTHIRTGHIGETDDVWDNGFYTNGFIYNFSVNFLVDSGSTASVITTDIFEKLPSNLWCLLVPNKSEISDVNGNNVSSIDSLTLDIKRFSVKLFLFATLVKMAYLDRISYLNKLVK